MTEIMLPAQIEYLIKSLNNPNDNVWQRQSYREHLYKIMKKIEGSIHQYDLEVAKVNKPVNKKKGVK